MREAKLAFRRGQELARQGRAQEASQSFAEAAARGMGAGALAHWALALNNLGQSPEALARIREARKSDPANPATQLIEALILFDCRDLGASAELAKGVIRRYPENQMAYNLLALIDWQTGRYREAIDSLQRVGICDNLDIRSRLMTEIQAAMPDPVAAAQETGDGGPEPAAGPVEGPAEAAEPPRRSWLGRFRAKRSLDRGVRLLYRGQAAAALEHFEQARRLSPDLGGLAYHTGVALVELGKFDRAGEALDGVAANDFFAIHAEFFRAVCRLKQGDFGEAERSLNQLRAECGRKPQVHDFREYIPWLLGEIEIKRGRPRAARAWYQQALSLWGPLLEQQLAEVSKLHQAGKYPRQAGAGPSSGASPLPVEGSPYPISGGQSVSSEEEKKDTGSEPVETPSTPSNTGSEAEAAPSTPSDASSAATAAPSTPSDAGSEPVETPSAPSDAGSEPRETPSAPSDAGSEPVERPSAPSDAGSEPVETPSAPSVPSTPSTSSSPEVLPAAAAEAPDEVAEVEAPPEAPAPTAAEEGEDLAPVIPVPVEDVICLEQDDSPTQRFYLLIRPQDHAYLRIGAGDRFIWRQLDGRTSLSQVAERFYRQYGALGFRQIRTFHQRLVETGFVKSAEAAGGAAADAFQGEVASARARLACRPVGPQCGERCLGVLHRLGGHFLGTEQIQGFLGILGLAGLAVFTASVARGSSGQASEPLQLAGYYSLAMVALYVWNVIGSAIHELGRGMTLKASHCETVSAGAVLRFAFLGFLVDIRDSQRLLRKLRVGILLSGAALEAFAAGLCGVAAINLPASALRDALALGAALLGLRVFLHASPFWRSALYTAVSEASATQHLRQAALKFLRPRYWPQLWRKSRWDRRELLFLGFGLWMVVWVTAAAKLAGFVLQTQVTGTTISELRERLLAGSTGLLLDAVVALLLILLVVIPAVLFLVLSVLYVCTSLYRAIRQSETSKRPLFQVAGFAVFSLILGCLGAIASAAGDLAGGAEVSRLAGLTVWALTAAAALVFALFLFGRTRRELESVAGSRTGLALLLGSLAVVLASHGALFQRSTEGSQPLVLAAGAVLGLFAFIPAAWNLFAFLATPFALPWLGMTAALGVQAFGGLLLSLAAVGAKSGVMPSAGWVSLFIATSWFFLTCGWSVWFIARTRPLAFPAPEAPEAKTDTELLANAFNYTLTTLLKNLTACGGRRPADGLRKRLQVLAATRAITLDWGRASGALLDPAGRKDEEFDGLATSVQDLVLLAITEGRKTLGAEAMANILRGIQKNLPWDARDALATHLVREPRWAAALAPSRDVAKGDRVKLLAETFLFQRFDVEEIEHIASVVSSRSVREGEDAIRQDDPGNEAFVIQKGSVDVLVEDEIGQSHLVAVLGAGDFFGELALLEDAPRSATVRAREDLDLLVLDRPIFERFVQRYGGAKDKLAESIRALRLIRRMPLFEEFSAGETSTVATKFRMEKFEAGRNVVTQGEPGEHFYVIQDGAADVLVRSDGEEEKVRTLRPGEYFGEIALLRDIPRTATVRAADPLTVFSLSKSDFRDLLGGHPFMVRKLERETERRTTTLRKHTEEHKAVP
jgi:CRP-like cAMP-binding protein/tetratricopeptide (TPR) repeat protein